MTIVDLPKTLALGARTGPLAGFRIVDLSRVVMGPLATSILADQGADVILIEDPAGDTNRFMGGGPGPEFSGISLNLLRNKRSITVDLKTDDGHGVFERLLQTADGFLTTLRPGSLERAHATYDIVRAINPDIVYCQAQGWPTSSDRADLPAYDDVIQAASGIPEIMERTLGTPNLLPTIVADKVSGLVLAQAMTAALLERQRTGQGQRVEVAMSDVMKAFVLTEHGAGAIATGSNTAPGYSRILTAERRPHHTSDGLVHLLPYHPEHYARLFQASGRPDLVGDPRYRDRQATIENAADLYREVRAAAASWTTAELIAFCRRNDIPATEVPGLDEILATFPVAEHPVVGEYRVIPNPVTFSRTPASLHRHAPAIGADTAEVVAETAGEERRPA